MTRYLTLATLILLSFPVHSAPPLSAALSATKDTLLDAPRPNSDYKASPALIANNPRPSSVIFGTDTSRKLIDATTKLGKSIVNTDVLFDRDMRPVLDIRPDELGDQLTKSVRRKSCRILSPTGGLSLDFTDIEPVRALERSTTFLVTCPKGVNYRLVMLENGSPVTAARIGLYDDLRELSPEFGWLRFTTDNYTPVNNVVFSSDGEPRVIPLKAILSADKTNELVSGNIRELGAIEIELIPN